MFMLDGQYAAYRHAQKSSDHGTSIAGKGYIVDPCPVTLDSTLLHFILLIAGV